MCSIETGSQDRPIEIEDREVAENISVFGLFEFPALPIELQLNIFEHCCPPWTLHIRPQSRKVLDPPVYHGAPSNDLLCLSKTTSPLAREARLKRFTGHVKNLYPGQLQITSGRRFRSMVNVLGGLVQTLYEPPMSDAFNMSPISAFHNLKSVEYAPRPHGIRKLRLIFMFLETVSDFNEVIKGQHDRRLADKVAKCNIAGDKLIKDYQVKNTGFRKYVAIKYYLVNKRRRWGHTNARDATMAFFLRLEILDDGTVAFHDTRIEVLKLNTRYGIADMKIARES